MKSIIEGIFSLLAVAFDKIPLLNKIKGYRSVVGFIGLAVLAILHSKGIGNPDVLTALEIGFTGFTALALNAKDNK